MSATHDAVWEALNKEPRPISLERARIVFLSTAASQASQGQSLHGMVEWFEKNGETMLHVLNADNPG